MISFTNFDLLQEPKDCHKVWCHNQFALTLGRANSHLLCAPVPKFWWNKCKIYLLSILTKMASRCSCAPSDLHSLRCREHLRWQKWWPHPVQPRPRRIHWALARFLARSGPGGLWPRPLSRGHPHRRLSSSPSPIKEIQKILQCKRTIIDVFHCATLKPHSCSHLLMVSGAYPSCSSSSEFTHLANVVVVSCACP